MKPSQRTPDAAPSQRPATVVDIARAVGVSHSTVSRALAGDPRIHPTTRERIAKAAQKLHYRPNLTARAIKSGSTMNLGVFCGGGSWVLYNSYFGRLLAGVAQAAQEDGMRVQLCLPKVASRDMNPAHDSVELTGIDELRDGRVDGALIVSGSPPQAKELRLLSEAQFPAMLVSNNVPVPGFSQLASGAYERVWIAADEIYRRGYLRIGFVGLFEGGDFNRQCLRALEDAARAAGISYDPRLMIEIPRWEWGDREQVQDALQRLRPAEPDALVFAQVEQAIAAESILEDQPDAPDLPLVSFGLFPRFLPRERSRVALIECDLIAEGERAYAMLRGICAGGPPRMEVMQWRWTKDRKLRQRASA